MDTSDGQSYVLVMKHIAAAGFKEQCLARLDFVSDPADEVIAATSIVEGVPLLTRDRTVRRSKLVPLA